MPDRLNEANDLLAKVDAPEGWLARRRLAKARQLLAELVAGSPTAPDILLAQAQLEALEGNAAAALATLERARPITAEISNAIAQVALALGDAARAEQHARIALEASPDDVDRMVHYAQALLLAGHTKRALGVITNACKLGPEHPRARPVLEQVRRVLAGEPAPRSFG